MATSARILIVEDEFAVAMELQDRLEHLGYAVVEHELRGQEAVERARQTDPDLVLMDIRLDGLMDGIEAARAIREKQPIPVVFVTAYSDDETLERAKATAPFGYVVKPFDERELYASIEVALNTHALQRQVEKARDDLHEILNGLRQGTAMTDAGGHLTFISDPAAALLGTTPSDALGAEWDAVFPFAPDTCRALRHHLAAGETTPVPAAVDHEDGPSYQMEVEVRPDPRDADRHIFTFYDVTETHDLRQMLDDQDRFHGIVGQSDPMQEVMEQIRAVAAVSSTVLIHGETGTGKELVAKAIHEESARADGPFVAVNCAALSADLAASQLFGHRKGAFTGATDDRQGYFEAADGGTLFLDEVGDVPLDVQRQLLRVLEERTVTRVGDTEPRPVDVRIVAATHRDLASEVQADRFREDLLYRIRIARIGLPPLRERRSDLPLLVRTFLREIRARMGADAVEVSDAAWRHLLNYAWPGNVRELRNALEAALIRAQGGVLRPGDLPPEITNDADVRATPAPDEEAERIRAALQQTGGNRTAAADLLGISRATLYRRLDEYGID